MTEEVKQPAKPKPPSGPTLKAQVKEEVKKEEKVVIQKPDEPMEVEVQQKPTEVQ